MKILVVEDEPDTIFLFESKCRDYLEEGIFAFVFSADGMEALNYLESCPPGELPLIALLDVRMPRMDGITLLGHLMDRWPFIACIMITAYGDMPTIRAAMNAGAFDFLTKPLDFNDLFMTINRALLRMHTREQIEQEQQELRQAYHQIKAEHQHITQEIWPAFLQQVEERIERVIRLHASSPTSLQGALARCEHLTILRAMARHNGNVTKAAAELEISRQALYAKLKKYDMAGE